MYIFTAIIISDPQPCRVASRLEAGIPILEVYYSDGSPMRVSDRHWLTTHLDAFEEFIDSDDETDGSISE